MTIISAYQVAGTHRGAAAICGTTRKTIKRVIQRAEAGGVRPPSRRRARNYEVVADLVAQRVKKSSGRITAKRLLPAVRAAGHRAPDIGDLVAAVAVVLPGLLPLDDLLLCPLRGLVPRYLSRWLRPKGVKRLVEPVAAG
jgi:hypothetical protein